MIVSRWLLLPVVLGSTCLEVRGQTDDERSEQLKQVFRGAAAGYEISAGEGAASEALALRDEPIMHWLSRDGTSGTYVGSVFVWTRRQRPEVVGTIFTPDGSKESLPVTEELYSYASGPLQVRSGNGTAWRPDGAEHMQPIPGAPVPAETAQGRRLQIRNLARHFSGRMNRRGVHHPLRLLSRPLYEYDGQDPEILTGALFVLVAYVTDPDILLLIEARQTADGPRWYYQPARFSDKSLWLSFKEDDIWVSMRRGHGTDAPNTADRQYHVEHATRDAPLKRSGDGTDDGNPATKVRH